MKDSEKELIMTVAKDLTVKLMDKINYKIQPTAKATGLYENVADMYQFMVTKVSEVLSGLG